MRRNKWVWTTVLSLKIIFQSLARNVTYKSFDRKPWLKNVIGLEFRFTLEDSQTTWFSLMNFLR